MRSKFLPIIICAAGLALPLSSHAATVIWGSWTAVTDNTHIATPAGYTYKGVNFNGSTTTINNGVGGTGGTDVEFIASNRNASTAVGSITVGNSGFDFSSAVDNSSVTSTVGSPQSWAAVLDRVIGVDNDLDATITLSGLLTGTTYTVQFFSSITDSNNNSLTRITSGGVNSTAFGVTTAKATRSITATFTADGGSQAFNINKGGSGSFYEPAFGALVIGVIPEPSAALLGGLGLLGLLRRRRN